MKTMRFVCLLAVLAATAPAQPSVAGTWNGNLHGVKAVTVTLRDSGASLEGTAVFYILRDEGSGFHSGAPSPEIALRELRRESGVLRFWLPGSNGQALSFEMRITGPATAELKRLKTQNEPELTVILQRQDGGARL